MINTFSFKSCCLLLLSLITFSCNQKSGEKKKEPYTSNVMFPYQLQQYTQKYKLPSDLVEVSGIAVLGENELVCVQDEKGVIFTYNLVEEKVVDKYKFAKNGDFEDIEVVGSTIYVLRSDGVIFQVSDFGGGNQVKELDNPLNEKNDTEGLGYRSESNSLWIACKARSGIGKHVVGFRAIYSYSIDNQKLSEKPIATIDLEHLEELADARLPFEPSGIAIHPITGDTYIISSVGKALVVLDSQGEIKHLQSLNHKGFKQPEGICFTKNGDLFISNEGRGGKGNILKFNYIQ